MMDRTSARQPHPAAEILKPVQYLKGVGPQRAELLERLGLRSARDVLFFFPRDYERFGEFVKLQDLEEDRPVSIRGVIEDVELQDLRGGRSMLGVLIRQGDQYLRAVWFNQPFMRPRFVRDRHVVLSGTARCRGLRWEMSHPRIDFLDDDESPTANAPLAVYPLTEGLRQHQMRRVTRHVIEGFAGLVDEVLPLGFRQRHDLLGIEDALRRIHCPASETELSQARRRFIYQELLVLQLALALRRSRAIEQSRSVTLETNAKIDARIRRLFPFPLTTDQDRAVQEICRDLSSGHAMNRLLQGDVGSGKTVVAEYAMLLTVAHDHQAVMMAPTEVLARQHVRTLERDLSESRVRIGLLTGSLGAAERRRTLEAIASGEINLIVGTHAVLQDAVRFQRLGLVVIDEQHKFGVRQRASLRQSGLDPHYLVMTATPIPRTMSMTMFGDLDVSTLREGPPGRQTVYTYVASPEQRQRWWEFFRKKLDEGRQGYVITPLVEENTDLPLASVRQTWETLQADELSGFAVGLIHGGMRSEEKEAAMQAFRRGEIRVLVATSVVEVGVDVANATLMTIEDGQRFGLAQLHQLRGRVSRGRFPGYVSVFADPRTDDARRRLDAFASTTDGFELAEIDFELRGPGELLGTRQHGLPPLLIADLQRDRDLLEEVRRDAQGLIAEDPHLREPDYARLRQMVLRRYGAALDLGDVG